jgi:flagellin-like protein
MRPKRKWAEEGVSPVIATILMVAITVVLAAALYAMIMIKPPDIQRVVGLLSAKKESAKEWAIEVAEVSPNGDAIAMYKVMVYNGSAKAVPSTVLGTSLPAYDAGGGRALQVAFSDLSDDGRFGRGDSFVFTFTSPPPVGSTYKLAVLWAENDAKLAEQTFNT